MINKITLKTFILLAFSCLLCGINSYGQVAGLPRPDHIVILIEENEAASTVICPTCSSIAPWLNALANDSNCAVFTNMSAIDHPSQPNYFDFYAGYNSGPYGLQQGGLTGLNDGDDSVTGWPFSNPNLGSQLLQAGLSFKTYAQDLPYVGCELNTAPPSYARKHNPVTNYQGTGTNQVPDSLNQPFTDWPDSANFDLLPTISYVVPDEDSDMHNGTGNPPITIGDFWFHHYLGSLLPWALQHNTLFIVTFDESNTLSATVNVIPTLFFGPMVKGGTYTQPVSLYSQLRTFEDMYGLSAFGGYAGSAADSTPITFCWKELSGINSPKIASDIRVYPNPANSAITFDGRALNGITSEMSITDVVGNQVAAYKLSPSFLLNVNTSEYAGGIYFYRLMRQDGMVESGKFVVTH